MTAESIAGSATGSTTGSTAELVLAIDTSVDVAVAVARGDQVLAERHNGDPRRHVEDLMPSIRSVLDAAGVDRFELTTVVCGLGPGPFTGLRVGIATGRMLASTLGTSFRGVCGLDAIAADWVARPVPPAGDFCVVTDARRHEVYWARYGADGRRLDGLSVGAATGLPELPVAGPGAGLCPEHRLGDGAPLVLSAGRLAQVGRRLPDLGVEPLYLRRPDAAEPSRRKSVLSARAGRR